MKLQRLIAKDFLGLAEADVDLSRPINLILGRNGAGKSSLRDGIQWILGNRCRSTDAAGRNADSLIRRGATDCRVALDWEDAGQPHHAERSRNGAGSKGPKEPVAMPDLLQALLDMPHLLRMSAADRSKVLSAVISPEVPLEDVQRHAMAMRVSDPAMASLLLGLQRISSGPYGPTELAEAYKRCYDVRKDKKRDLASLEAKLQALPAPQGGPRWAETVRKSVELITAEEADLREKSGVLRQQRSEWNQFQVRRRELERQVAELEAQLAKPQEVLPMERSVGDLEARVAQLGDAYQGAENSVSRAREKRLQAESDARVAEQRVEQARQGDASCPAHVTEDPCPVLLQGIQERLAQVGELETAAKRTASVAKKALATEAIATTERANALGALEDAQSQLASAREAAARNQGSAEASLDAIQAELDRINEQYPEDADPLAQIVEGWALQEVIARREKLQAELREIEAAARSAEERKKLDAEAGSLREAVCILEELVPVLEPRGLPARLLAERIGPVEKRINEQLAIITGGEYRVAIRAERGVDLGVFRGGSNLALPPENLSTSERLRVGVALGQAVSIMSGLRILVIDEAEMLDPENRGLLMRGIQPLAGQIETTIILATAERPTTVTTDQLGVFWVEDGTVQAVDADLVERLAPSPPPVPSYRTLARAGGV